MNPDGQFVAALLDASPKSFAASAVLSYMESSEAASAHVNAYGFERLIAIMQERLVHLAEALACGRPEVFECDLQWTLGLECGVPVEPALLRGCVAALQGVAENSVPVRSRALVNDYIVRGLAAIDSGAAPTSISQESDAALEDLRQSFQAALLDADQHRASQVVLVALNQGVSVEELQSAVLGRTQVEFGKLWSKGAINVAQEHFASRVVEDLIARLRSTFEGTSSVQGVALLASVAGNNHDIGLRILADQFERNGWRTVFLGADMPQDDLLAGIASFNPRFVALSITLLRNLRSAAATIAEIKGAHPELPVLIGGSALQSIDGLWRDLGADAYAGSAKAGVAWARDLTAD